MAQEIIECGCKTTVVEKLIAWCNVNDGFVSAILALITALAAIFIPMYIANKQNKITMKNENEIEIKLTHEEEAFILEMLEKKKAATDDLAERTAIEALVEKIREEIGH